MGTLKDSVGVNTIQQLKPFLLGYWPGDDASGGMANAWDGDFDLSEAGTASFTYGETGLSGDAIKCTLNDDSRMVYTGADKGPTGDYYVGYWFKSVTTVESQYMYWFEYGVSGSDRIAMFNNNTGSWAPQWRNGGTSFTPATLGADAYDSAWHYIAVGRCGDRIMGFIDDTFQGAAGSSLGDPGDWNDIAFFGSTQFPSNSANKITIQHIVMYDKWIGRHAHNLLYNGGTKPVSPITGLALP